jgi:hypothetical protein
MPDAGELAEYLGAFHGVEAKKPTSAGSRLLWWQDSGGIDPIFQGDSP